MTLIQPPREQDVVLAHVSDIHFGAQDPRMLVALHRALAALAPDFVVVSGDLTQRARRGQFTKARRWLDALPAPFIVVPGNHDVPLYDLPRRIFSPLGRYEKMITRDRAPLRTPAGVRLLGLDSTRRRVTGRLQPARLRAVTRIEPGARDDLRIVTVHHPLTPTQTAGYENALRTFAAARVDVVLTGHTHLSGRRIVADGPGAGLLLINAGTTTSVRVRTTDPVNSFNVLRWDRSSRLTVERWRARTAEKFVPDGTFVFRRCGEGWRAVPSG